MNCPLYTRSVVLHINDGLLDNLDFASTTAGSACFSGGGLDGNLVGVGDHLDVLLGDLDDSLDLSDELGSLASSNGLESESAGTDGFHTSGTNSASASNGSQSSGYHHLVVSGLFGDSGTTAGHHSSVVHSSLGEVRSTSSHHGALSSKELGSSSGGHAASSVSEESLSSSVRSDGSNSSEVELDFTTVSSLDSHSSEVGNSLSAGNVSGVSDSSDTEDSGFVSSESFRTTHSGNSSVMVTSSHHDSSFVSTEGHSFSVSNAGY